MEFNSVCNHTSDNKIGRPRSGSPICLSRVCLQTELYDTKSYYQLLNHKNYNFRENEFSEKEKRNHVLHFILSLTQLTQYLQGRKCFRKHRAIETPPSKHASVTNRNVTQQCSRHYSTPLPVFDIISQACWSANGAPCLGRGRRMSQILILSSQLWRTNTVPREE